MELFIAIALTHFMALLSPGPDFLLLLTTLLHQGKTAARQVSVGIAAGNAIILVALQVGLSMAGGLDAEIFYLIRIAGSIYLLYLAVLCFYRGFYQWDDSGGTEMPGMAEANVPHSRFSGWGNVALGLQSSLFNPKNILFYSNLMLLVDGNFNTLQTVGLSLWMVVMVLSWNMLLLRLFSHSRLIRRFRQKSRWLYYVSGSGFVLFAVLLLYA
ncbi:LysE family translocator [Acinetobacter sp. WZC-1]|uniref:LysE family translocator n=1 Tax=Acinetobacter sp. WZC-1 TaxID=3459034 RepID=UPI00403E3386